MWQVSHLTTEKLTMLEDTEEPKEIHYTTLKILFTLLNIIGI